MLPPAFNLSPLLPSRVERHIACSLICKRQMDRQYGTARLSAPRSVILDQLIREVVTAYCTGCPYSSAPSPCLALKEARRRAWLGIRSDGRRQEGSNSEPSAPLTARNEWDWTSGDGLVL